MEEPVSVRYVFMMLLAIADPEGSVIGTDVAIARRLNIPTNEFTRCVETLGTPDPHSNSQEREGRRVVPSEGERGYLIVNYRTYRGLKDESERREYMREYMRNRRKGVHSEDVAPVNSRKHALDDVTQADVESEIEAKAKTEEKKTPKPPKGAGNGNGAYPEDFESFWQLYPRRVNKGDALKAWNKIKPKPSPEELSTSLEWQKRSDQWIKEGGQYIPHPASWLNARGWENEPTLNLVQQPQKSGWND